jgi:tryptophan halogenase
MKEAIAFPTEDTEEYNIYTTSTALDYGWMFNIPTYGRHGNGYIFDSDFINADQAKEEVEKILNKKINIGKHIKFDPGAIDTPWIKNCVAIGLSANFVEPLEATSIGTSIQQIFLLTHYLPGFTKKDTDQYNESVNGIMENIKDFILLHYVTNKKNTNFWKNLKKIKLTDSLTDNLEKWKTRLPIDEDLNIYKTKYKLFNSINFIQILYGLDILHINNLKRNFSFLNKEVISEVLQQMKIFDKQEKLNLSLGIGHKKYLNTIRELN